MLVAIENGQRVEAREAKRGGVFTCPQCKHVVVFKPGRTHVPHFAHKSRKECTWAKGETTAHLDAKEHVLNALRARGVRAEPEYYLSALSESRRADILLWRPNGKQFAIELQHSDIGLDEIERRAFSYAEQDIAQIWLPFLKQETLDKAEPRADGSMFLATYSARPFVKWVHGFHQSDGMWMYCPADKSFWKARLAPHYMWKPTSEYHDEYGEEQSAGGYERRSKQHRELSLQGPYSFDAMRITTRKREASSRAHYRWPGGRIGMLIPEHGDP